MGYTHYWENPGFTQEQWEKGREYAKRILDNTRVQVQFEYDVNEPPVYDHDIIRFNGVGDEGHETFYVESHPSRSFGFCKTAYKPYDELVVAMLMMLNHVNPEFTWSSDGEASDHENGRQLWESAK